MPANALTVFAAKAPVEPTAPTLGQQSDNDFKDFMDTAVHKVEEAQKSSKDNSPQSQKNAQAEKSQPSKTRAKSSSRSQEDSAHQEVSGPVETNKAESGPETADSLVEDTEVLAAQLRELDINQEQFDALLDLLGLNGGADMDALLQSLSQALNLNQNNLKDGISPADLIAKIQQNDGEAINLLKQAGLSDTEAKNLLDHLQTLQNASAQKELGKNADVQAKISAQTQESDEADTKFFSSESSSGGEEEGPDFLTQFKETSKGAEKTDRSASADKLPETSKQNETARITQQEPVDDKGAKTSNLGELLNDKNGQANILQTEGLNDGKGISKGGETAKASSDLQVQSPAATTHTVAKAVESSKPILPENLLARGATEAKIINQIADKMTVRTTGAQNEVHIKLDPPSLGTVRMNITTSGDSVRTVIVAENQAVKQVIESNFNQLRDAMSEQGLKVDSFTVTVGGESNDQNSSGESMAKENNQSSFEQVASNEADNNSAVHMDSVFFGDNQSISVIA